jgi:hypothetical protein
MPLASPASKVARGLGFVGTAALGAAVYGQWLAPEPMPGASALLGGGIVASVAALFLRSSGVPPVRVGELGVMFGDPPEAGRVCWCDIDAVRVVGDALELAAAPGAAVGGPVRIPLAAHARAASRILAEAALRIPARVDVAPKAHERLPPLVDSDGELVPAAHLQLTGRKCAASGTSITFEADALLCSNCAALYHVSHAPAECLRCGRPLGKLASAQVRSG